MNKIRFATIGTSSITEKWLSAAKTCDGFEYYAAYSRNADTARAFGGKHGARIFYDSLEALGSDPSVDAVYIASPNALHYSQTVQMLEAGKHVLCEKALASNFPEASAMIHTAHKKHLILMEAMRSLSDPGMTAIRENLSKLGTIRRAIFSFCQYSSRYDKFKAGNPVNIFSRDMSAGALMDIGIYCVEPMIALFGKPDRIFAASAKIRGNIDGSGTILAQYPEMTAELIYSKITASDTVSEIQGENGTMYIQTVARPDHLFIQYNDGTCEEITAGSPENNMHFETDVMLSAIQGKTDITPLQRISLDTMALLDEARAQTGIVFPADPVSS